MIDLKGKVVGMTGLIHAFIPSSVILKCLKLWHKFRYVFFFSSIFLLCCTSVCC